MKVYIVNMICEDDREDNTQIVAVYSSKKLALQHVSELGDESIDANVEEHTVETEFVSAMAYAD